MIVPKYLNISETLSCSSLEKIRDVFYSTVTHVYYQRSSLIKKHQHTALWLIKCRPQVRNYQLRDVPHLILKSSLYIHFFRPEKSIK